MSPRQHTTGGKDNSIDNDEDDVVVAATAADEDKSESDNKSSTANTYVPNDPPVSGADLGVWESSLEDRAGLMSRWLLSYLTPLLQLGSHKLLDAGDMGVPSKEDQAQRAYDAAWSAWAVQAEKCQTVNAERKRQ